MAAYIVFVRERVRDAEAFAGYSSLAVPSLAGHPGKPLVYYGGIETLEGPPAEGLVVVEFPGMAEARAWYDSPAYTAARAKRFASADFRVFITEGLSAA